MFGCNWLVLKWRCGKAGVQGVEEISNTAGGDAASGSSECELEMADAEGVAEASDRAVPVSVHERIFLRTWTHGTWVGGRG